MNTVARYAELAHAYVGERVRADKGWRQFEEALEARSRCNRSETSPYKQALPILTCLAVGGEIGAVQPLAGAWLLLDMASDIFDDIQDGDKHEWPWNEWEPALAFNVGLAAVFAAQACLAELGAPDSVMRDIQTSFASAGFLAAREQAMPATDLESYFRRVFAISGHLFGIVARAGAMVGSSDAKAWQAAYDYGLALGVLIQIGDDGSDFLTPEGDLTGGRMTLPLLYLHEQRAHPQYPCLLELLCDKTLQGRRPEELRTIAAAMGAFDYIGRMAVLYRHKALAALAEMPSASSIHLLRYIDLLAGEFPSRPFPP